MPEKKMFPEEGGVTYSFILISTSLYNGTSTN